MPMDLEDAVKACKSNLKRMKDWQLVGIFPTEAVRLMVEALEMPEENPPPVGNYYDDKG